MSFHKRGVTLVTSVILIVFASVSVLSTTTFIVQRFSQNRAKSRRTQSLYLAQAGAHNALYNFRYNDTVANGYFSLGQTNVDTENYFIVGGTDADMLMVDTHLSYLGGALTQGECQALGQVCTDTCNATRDACRAQCDADRDACRAQADANRQACRNACPGGPSGATCRANCDTIRNAERALCDAIRTACRQDCDTARQNCRDDCSAQQDACIDATKLINVFIQNATNSRTVTIDRMIVSWQNARNLVEIVIDGTFVWSGSLSSPADANLSPNFTLDTLPTYYSLDYLRFDGSMAGATVNVQFVMTDGSTQDVAFFPASNNFNFTVKSTGKTTGSNVYRTFEARYNALTGKVVDYGEINVEITP